MCKSKHQFAAVAFVLFCMLVTPPQPKCEPSVSVDTSVLTGTTKLACEALLCLSSNIRPGECTPSLDYFFSIQRKEWSDTLSARKAFLNLCPAATEIGMPELVDAITNGAGRCDAASLNRRRIPVFRLFDIRQKKWTAWQTGQTAYPVCTTNDLDGRRNFVRRWSDGDNYSFCQEKKTIIDSSLPSYCRPYVNHEYTDLGLRFDGDPYAGGKWLD